MLYIIYLQNSAFFDWAMLSLNQRPLPCEGSTIVRCRCAGFTKSLQTVEFTGVVLFLRFQVIVWVAARLLHTERAR